MRYLTKTRFTKAITCPTKLAYLDDQTYANAEFSNDFLVALAVGGHQVGALAKCLFPEGIEVDAAGHDAQVEQTMALLSRDNVCLFEAAIRVGRLFVRIDLLHKRGTLLELFEVKAKSYDSREGDSQILTRNGISSEFKPYLYDLAFQRHVLRRAFPNSTIVSHLVLPDKAKVCPEEGLPQRLSIRRRDPRSIQIDVDPSLRDGAIARELLHVLPADQYLDKITALELKAGGYTWTFEEGIAELESHLDGPTIEPRPGNHCKNCEFRADTAQLAAGLRDGRMDCWTSRFKISSADLSNGTVLDLCNFRGVDTAIQGERIALRDLEPEHVKYKPEDRKISLSHRQWLQCEESRGVVTGPFAITAEIAASLEALRYPIHFVDFETATPALPFHAGMHPYELLFFQFSHHQVEADRKVVHATQYLEATSGSFPNFNAIRALATSIGDDDGSIVHWWSHERTVLFKIREQLLTRPDAPTDRGKLVAFIDSLLGTKDVPGRLIDLGQRIVQPFVFLPGTRGSSSLKNTLPALLKYCPGLQRRYGSPIYGTPDGIPSMNFSNHTWIQLDEAGLVKDPYQLLSGRFNDVELDALEKVDDNHSIISNGGAAMVAYSLLQDPSLSEANRADLVQQLFRYCELDTFAMVMVFEGLQELLINSPPIASNTK